MITRCRPLLGTFVEITVPEGDGTAAEQAFAAIEHVQRRMSFHESGSDLARLRDADPDTIVMVDRATVEVLRVAIDLHLASGGLFDVAIGCALVRSGFLPRAGLGQLRAYPGTMADLDLIDDTHVCVRRRTLLDLGGIAKGFAVDRAIAVLEHAGVAAALVNAGGDLRGFGPRDWPVHLRDADGEVRFMVPIRNCAMATSSNLVNRRRYRGSEQSPHIGAGGKCVLVSHRVSVIAATCIAADALTKVALADPALAGRLAGRYGARLLDPPKDGSAQ